MQTDLADPAAAEAHHRRVRYVATYFPLIQGLRGLPLAGALIVSSIWLVVDAQLGVGAPFLRLVAVAYGPLIGALLAQVPIRNWYRRTFGSATMTRRTKQQALLFALLSLLVALLVGPVLKPSQAWMTPALLGLGAVFCAAYFWLTGKVARHYLWFGAAMLALGAVDVAGVSPFCAAVGALHAAAPGNCTLASLFFYLGAMGLVTSVLDHRLLARTLPRVPKESG